MNSQDWLQVVLTTLVDFLIRIKEYVFGKGQF